MTARLLFVTNADLAAPRGGRALLSALHHDCLRDLLGQALSVERLGSTAGSPLGAVRGYIDGVTPGVIAAVLVRLRTEEIGTVWLDGSNLGRLAQAIRQAVPAVSVITFCHNVEARFFLGAFRQHPGPKAAGVLIANHAAERLAVRHSDRVVALSARDSAGLRRLYGRGADELLPMAMADTLPPSNDADPERLVDPAAPLLFVGGAFYANRAGIAWFARNVAPRIDVATRVVGQGMAAMRAELEGTGVEVIGAVDHLAQCYREARVAIAPIFAGSGMKTKVAEALMFGKRVIGTPEAFSGYEAIAAQAGWVCRTADDFVAAIKAARALPIKALDPALRALYERDHSPAATRARLATILAAAAPARPRMKSER